MGKDDDIGASLAHVVLGCVSGLGVSKWNSKSFTHPGFHANCFLHAICGVLKYQSGCFKDEINPYYVTYKATQYLALPSLMADLYVGEEDPFVSGAHLVSGVIPFALAVSGCDNPHLGNVMIGCNILSLCYYSLKHDDEWGWLTAGSACLAYFVAPQCQCAIVYPLSLSVMSLCAYRMYHKKFDEPVDPKAKKKPPPKPAPKPKSPAKSPKPKSPKKK